MLVKVTVVYNYHLLQRGENFWWLYHNILSKNVKKRLFFTTTPNSNQLRNLIIQILYYYNQITQNFHKAKLKKCQNGVKPYCMKEISFK